MWWSSSFWCRVAVALLLLMCRCGRYPPSSGVGRADASAVRSGGSGGGGDEKNGATAGGGSRWKHKGVGIGLGSGGGGGGSSHRWPNAAGRRTEMDLNVGLLMPKTSFKVRGYLRAIHDAIQVINKAYKKNRTTNFSKIYDFEERNVRSQMMSLTPSPTGRPQIHNTTLITTVLLHILYDCTWI
ncbi:glutamate receptor ionotropic, NMDA 2B isoform X3 [Aphis craccivora]|uniref:Glutamate receptor ionotropic, NMDA 2B isoform X3 n=1 Tax=Aphis craccivora TaxID=307492 RepID=A0A6G0ZMZ0_APHCR|nr:glutamate receptor ionotropic, NMDA 2B isoform X3 [Aphis craccivora]